MMEFTTGLAGSVIVSASQRHKLLSQLAKDVQGEAGAYYTDTRRGGKIFGSLQDISSSQPCQCLCVSIGPLDEEQVSFQTFLTTFRPYQTFTTNCSQECSKIIQDLQKSKFCNGIQEEVLLPHLTNFAQSSFLTSVFLIERDQDIFIYRSRKCEYIVNDDDIGQCKSCRELFDNVSGLKERSGDSDNNVIVEKEETCNVFELNSETETFLKLPLCHFEYVKDKNDNLKSHIKKCHRKDESDALWTSVGGPGKLGKTFSVHGKNYSRDTSLEQQEKLVLEPRDPADMESCHICGKVFKKRSTLWGHIKTHEDGGHVCHVCGAKFKVKSYLHRHMRTHDPESRKYVCHICGDKFSRPYLMRQHQEYTHNKNLPFKCELCGKKLRSSTFLKIHLRSVHSKEKPFPCEVCGFRSSRVDNLNIHRTKVHNLPSKITRTQLQTLVAEGKHPFCSNPEDIPEY